MVEGVRLTGKDGVRAMSPPADRAGAPRAGSPILLVEDEDQLRKIICRNLEKRGYRVVAAETGAAALTALRAAPPALLLLDVNLRHLSGFEILHALRQDPQLHDMRVLMASGMDMTYRSRQEGADGFIAKPFEPDELIQTIQDTLG